MGKKSRNRAARIHLTDAEINPETDTCLLSRTVPTGIGNPLEVDTLEKDWPRLPTLNKFVSKLTERDVSNDVTPKLGQVNRTLGLRDETLL